MGVYYFVSMGSIPCDQLPYPQAPAILDTSSMSNRTGDDGFALVAARHAMTASEGSENYGALPSSYRRRVRKSTSVAAIQSSNLRLRLKRSVPFLRRRSTTTFYRSPEPSWERQEEVVQLARAQYFGGADDPETAGAEQFRLHRVNGREQRTFRKSVRSSEIVDENVPSAVKRSSSFSTTLRNRVRKVIGRTLSRKNSLPPQQLEAQRNYFSELGPEVGFASGFDAYQVTENTPRKNDACTPALDSEFLEDLDKFPYTDTSNASRESLHSNARSRVTSWTNSSATGSIGLRSGPIERNRLSIIKEDGGPHQPSSSAGKHFGGVEREPLQSANNSNVGLPAIDSQRIYSALIKRIDEEEAEVERTRLAVADLRQEREESNNELTDTKMTIRAVYSDSSLVTATRDQRSQRLSSQAGSWDVDQPVSDTNLDLQHKENVGKRRERLTEQESRSSFFPFSSEQSPETPSPFKKFLNERRGRARSRSRSRSSDRNHVPDTDDGSVIVNRQPGNPVMNRLPFGLSSASVYSRTTNGGFNDQYRSAIDSSDELLATEAAEAQPKGMATILPATYVSYAQDSWNPWSDTIDRQERAPDRKPHTRERAQINSEENEDRAPSKFITRRNSLVGSDVTPRTRTPRVQIVIGPGQSHNQLSQQKSVDALSNISNKADDGSKGSGSIRKLSPGNLARLFKERTSQKQPRPQSAGKENGTNAAGGSPPISTPGRLHLQFRNGASTGRLRKRASETAFQTRNGVYSTPHNSVSTTPSRSHESPSEIAKTNLVARLSRPFNMDVPPHNRPFDSMYLGKRTFGHPDTFGHNRLSVAPNGTSESNRENGEDETTALPSRSVSAGKSAAKMFGLLGSKRMVSNFLKSRRGDKSTSAEEYLMADGSPAFV